MTKHMMLAGLSVLALALASAGCNAPSETNTNAHNGNTAVAMNANANANANANTRIAAEENRNRAITREDYERDKDRYGREAKESGSSIGKGADDLWLWTKTRAALLAEDNLRDSTINVDVDNAVVTLRGTVANADQRTRAESVAKGIEGVKSVKNTLKVNPNASMVSNGNSNTKTTNSKKS